LKSLIRRRRIKIRAATALPPPKAKLSENKSEEAISSGWRRRRNAFQRVANPPPRISRLQFLKLFLGARVRV
jgi:hypothetical protein